MTQSHGKYRLQLTCFAALFSGLMLASHTRLDVAANDPRVRYEGRVAVDSRGRVRFAWPRSAVHLRFQGTQLAARLFDDAAPERDADALGVEVDGGSMRRVAMHHGGFEYALAEGLSRGVHTLRVLKLTESEVGTVRVEGFSTPGGSLLQATPAPRRRVLAIGDSITAGYGVRGADATCCGTDFNDVSQSWVSLASDALGAELHVIAWSGRGLVHNFDPAERATLIDLFERQIATEPDAPADLRAWVPDDVVLNVGTNDAIAPGFDAARYERALDGFVRRLRSLYPHARVVLAVGPLLSDYYPTLESRSRARILAATVAVAARDSARCSVLELSNATDDEGCGCSKHPSARTQARMARALLEALQ